MSTESACGIVTIVGGIVLGIWHSLLRHKILSVVGEKLGRMSVMGGFKGVTYPVARGITANISGVKPQEEDYLRNQSGFAPYFGRNIIYYTKQ